MEHSSIVLCVYCKRPKTHYVFDAARVRELFGAEAPEQIFLDAAPCLCCPVTQAKTLLVAEQSAASHLTGNYVHIVPGLLKSLVTGAEYREALDKGYLVLGPAAWCAVTKRGMA